MEITDKNIPVASGGFHTPEIATIRFFVLKLNPLEKTFVLEIVHIIPNIYNQKNLEYHFCLYLKCRHSNFRWWVLSTGAGAGGGFSYPILYIVYMYSSRASSGNGALPHGRSVASAVTVCLND